MVDLFARAKTAPTKVAPKAKKSDKVEHNIAGILDLATIDALMETLAATKASLTSQIKSQMKAQFVEDGEAAGKRPNNFRGVEGTASASCELKKRSTASVLSDEEVALLEGANIPYEKAITVQEAFLFNPAYATNTELMGRVSKALEKVAGLPGDFIQYQAEVSKNIATEASLDAVFKTGVAEDLLDVVGVLSLKPAASTADIKDVLARVVELLGVEAEEAE